MRKILKLAGIIVGLLLIGQLPLAGFIRAEIDCTSSGHTDDFSSSTLDPAWTPYNFFPGGPSYSLTANPGCFCLTVPSGQPYDQWIGVDNAPEIRRADMGSGNFEIETHLDLQSYTEGASFHTGLMIRFGAGDIILWGPVGGTRKLEASRSGTPELTKFIGWNKAEVFLKIQKSGCTYTFFHKEKASDRWVSDGQVRDITDTVASVGLITKTWTAGGAAVTTDFDYFNLITGTSSSDDCGSTGRAYHFGNIFERYIPLAGPLISIPPNIPGQATYLKCTRFDVPGDQAYDHWTSVDNAPQLRREDMGSGDWTIETEANLILYQGGSFHTGLKVRFSRYDLFYWGFDNNTDIQLDRSGTPNIKRVANSSPRIWLKIEKTGSTYKFYYKTSSGGSWILATSQTVSYTVDSVGLIAKTWNPNPLVVDFNYFTLTKPSVDAGSGCASFGHTDDFGDTVLTSAWTAYFPLAGPSYSLTIDVQKMIWTKLHRNGEMCYPV